MTSLLILIDVQILFDVRPIREQDGQASGGNDFGSDDWIFTIREKDPKKLQNGEGQSGVTDQVRRESITAYVLLGLMSDFNRCRQRNNKN